ncbi:hypothetical protein BV22DRAFT_565971 [Leucogyrophana mollusca]|uniref:Uncharacterized protein n=1 Tax=Leucogyrophana mollusca TaxID=85980 RepID=A0ACB8BD54_9AGAM|nr:hypothetical protein BV22DRAFT_565971 [Leucogyrophana mollusca]
MGKKWYVVRIGTIPGVYTTWIEASAKIENVPGAVHQAFDTLEEARAVFEAASARGEVRAVKAHPAPLPTVQSEESEDEGELLSPVPLESALLGVESASAPLARRKNVGNIFQTRPHSSVEGNRDSMWTTSFTEPPTEVTQYEPSIVSPFVTPRRRPSPRATMVSDSSRAYPDPLSPRTDLGSKSRPTGRRKPGLPEYPADEPPTPRMLQRAATSPNVSYPDLNDLHAYTGTREVWVPQEPSKFRRNRGAKATPALIRSGSFEEDVSPSLPVFRGVGYGSERSRVKPARGDAACINSTLSLPALSAGEGSRIACVPEAITSKPRAVKGKGKAKAPSSPAKTEPTASPMKAEYREDMTPSPIEYKITLYCPHPQDCRHEPSGFITSVPCSPSSEVARETVHSRPRYVDAAVSPIRSASSVNSPSRRKGSASSHAAANIAQDQDESLGARSFGVPHIPHKGYNAEVDVRSPISRGTRVPMGIAEATIFGRPSPPMPMGLNQSISALMINRN